MVFKPSWQENACRGRVGKRDWRIRIRIVERPRKADAERQPPTGSAEANPFGAFTDYSYIVSSSSRKHNTPLYEGTHVWFQTDVSKPFNYIVAKVAEHITDTKYALKEVAASEN